VDSTLWPEYQELDRVLRETLDRATDRVLAQVFGQDVTEAEVRDEPGVLGPLGAVNGSRVSDESAAVSATSQRRRKSTPDRRQLLLPPNLFCSHR